MQQHANATALDRHLYGALDEYHTTQSVVYRTHRYTLSFPYSKVQENQDRVEECGIPNDVKMERRDRPASTPHILRLATEGKNVVEEEQRCTRKDQGT